MKKEENTMTIISRDEKMKEITDRLQAGLEELFNSEKYAKYLRVMSQFHHYSFNNTLLIAMQKPDATLVAGYNAWEKKFNRHVLKGEKGIQIIAPAPVKEKKEQERIDSDTGEVVLQENGQPEMVEVTVVIPRFKVSTVFDLSQTEGEPLPELGASELTASVENYDQFMIAIRSVAPVPIRFDEIRGGAKGYYDNANKEIVIQSGMSEMQTMKTAVHETAHAILHDKNILQEQGIQKDQMTREVEAESVAFVSLAHFELDTSDYSFPYIAGWSSGRDTKELKASLDTIRKASSEIIDGIEASMREHMLVMQKNEVSNDVPIIDHSFVKEDLDVTRKDTTISMEEPNTLAVGYDAGFIIAQRTDEGYDYTILNMKCQPLDGGVLDSPDLGIHEAMAEILKGEGLDADNTWEANYETIMVEAEKADIQKAMKEPMLSFYVAENMEYPVMGEYHEVDTLAEAVKLYQENSGGKLHGIGISYSNGTIPLVQEEEGGPKMTDLAEQYSEDSLIQQAYEEAKQVLSLKDGQEKPETRTAPAQKGGTKESVVKALQERKAQIKERERQTPVQKSHKRKRGEQTL